LESVWGIATGKYAIDAIFFLISLIFLQLLSYVEPIISHPQNSDHRLPFFGSDEVSIFYINVFDERPFDNGLPLCQAKHYSFAPKKSNANGTAELLYKNNYAFSVKTFIKRLKSGERKYVFGKTE